MTQPPCIECEERPSVPFQGGLCGPCRRRRHENLTPELAERLAELACTAAEDLAGTNPLGAVELRGLALKLGSRKKLSDEYRAIAAQLVFGYAQVHEQDHGQVDPVLERLYRRLAHVDRRTGQGPPWSDLLDSA